MDKENVYYINIKPYRISLPFDIMASRYYNAILIKNTIINETSFVKQIVTYMNQYNYMVLPKSDDETKIDSIVSKKLYSNLDDFFKKERKIQTRKKRNRRTKTNRNYNINK